MAIPYPVLRADAPRSVEPVARAWQLSAAHHHWEHGASPEAVEGAEAELGRRLPRELVAIYEMSDGMGILDGNLGFFPLRPRLGADITSVARGSGALRRAGWQVPPELVVFGSNGAGELFGVWLPDATDRRPETAPVIELGATSDPRCLAIVGTTLSRFLTVWTAFYSQLVEADPACLEALDAPKRLRNREPTEGFMRSLFEWADPGLPNHVPDPYENGLTPDEVRGLFGTERHVADGAASGRRRRRRGGA